MNKLFLWLLLIVTQSAPPSAREHPGLAQVPVPPNIVLIVLDDFGVELLGAYGEYPPDDLMNPPVLPYLDAPLTPNLDDLAAGGLLFRNCWTDPLCTPTRAQILTGKHGFRTGVGAVISANNNNPNLGLDRSQVTIPEKLARIYPYPYRSSGVGKWHLSDDDDDGDPLPGQAPDPDFLGHPLDQGFGNYSGAMFNISKGPVEATNPCMIAEERYDYCQWIKNDNGVEVCENQYATLNTAADALVRAEAMAEPWFLYVSFNAPHSPFHLPPDPGLDCAGADSMHCSCTPTDPKNIGLKAMVEYLDTQIGTLVDGVRVDHPDTLFIVIGDNGTDGQAIVGLECFPYMQAKGTMFEAGVNVPLIINGPGVTTGEVPALVASTDIFATVVEVAGGNSSLVDSVSMVPFFTDPDAQGREFVYAEKFSPNFEPGQFSSTVLERHSRAIRDRDGYKLVVEPDRNGVQTEKLYLLPAIGAPLDSNDPCETVNFCPSPTGPCGLSMASPHYPAYVALVAELQSMGVYP